MDFYSKSYDSSYGKSLDLGLRLYMIKIYQYVAVALMVTSTFAFLSFSVEPIRNMLFVFGSYGEFLGQTFLGLIASFAPMIIGFVLSFGYGSITASNSRALFMLYAATMGVALSYLGILYTGISLARTACITAVAFGVMSFYGYTTKRDLTSLGGFLLMGLIGVFVAMLANLIIRSPAIYYATSAICVVIFTGLIAWDTQKIKKSYYSFSSSGNIDERHVIMSAFSVYLNIVNLFVYLVRFFGVRKSD